MVYIELQLNKNNGFIQFIPNYVPLYGLSLFSSYIIMNELSDANRAFKLHNKSYVINDCIQIHGKVKYDIVFYEKIYDCFKNIINILDSICPDDYWLIGGTLLGTIRNKCILPWDNDIDIAITTKAFKLISKKTIFIHENTSFTIIPNIIGFKIYEGEQSICDLFVIDYLPNTNIMVYSGPFIDNKSYYYTHIGFSNIMFRYNDVYPLVKLRCGEIHVNCPSKYKKLLFQNYNKNVLNEIKFPRYNIHNNIYDCKIAHKLYLELVKHGIKVDNQYTGNLYEIIIYLIGNINMGQYK